MAKNSAQQLAISSRRIKVAELYLKGYRSAYQVRDAFDDPKPSRQTIQNDLKALREQWKHEAVQTFDAAMAEELAKISRLEREAWDAWERSKAYREKNSTSRNIKASGVETSARIEKENLIGDPRYLTQIAWCIDRRAKMLGLDAPDRHEISMNGETHIVERIIIDRRDLPADVTPAPATITGTTGDMPTPGAIAVQ